MSCAIIIRGPLGVGRTTVGKQLAQHLGGEYISVDAVLDEHDLAHADEKIGCIPFSAKNPIMSTRSPSRFTHHALHITFYVLLFLLPLHAAFPLWGPGMVNTRGGGDSPFLLQRTLDMAENLRHGIFPPRWMAHAAYDLGTPFFNHYAALPFYLSGGLTALGMSPILAIQATQTLGFILAALTMALWAQRVYRSRAAVLLAVTAYTFAPFHLVNVYVRGDSLSEFYAFVWYPLILWTLARAAERATARRIILAALSYAALILTHNVSALIFAPFALLYAASQQKSEKAEKRVGESASQRVGESASQRVGESANRRASKSRFAFHALRMTHDALRITSPFLLAFLLTAWFWIPAIGETGYGQLGPEFTAGYFHYSNHFRGLNLVQPTLFFDYNISSAVREAGPFAMGLAQAALAVLGVGALVWQISEKTRTRESKPDDHVSRITHHPPPIPPHPAPRTPHGFILVGLFLSTFMITPLSAPLWERLPLLATTQFPWRFLSVQALFTAIAAGAIASEKASRRESKSARKRVGESEIHNPQSTIQDIACGLLCLLLAITALASLRPERLLIAAEDVTWDNLLLYESFTGNIGTTIRYEYLPRDVQPRLYISEAVVDGVDAAQPIAAGGIPLAAALLERAPTRQVWQLTLESPAPVAFPLHWWPGWQAEMDGNPAAAYPLTGSGRLTVDLAAGEHTVTLQLRDTPLRAAAAWISALTVVVLLVVLFQRRGAETQRCRGFPFLRLLRFPLLVIGVSLSLSVLFPAVVSQRVPPASPQTFDFIQSPFPTRGAVYFGTPWHARRGTGDAVLVEVGPLPETAAPGETLTIPLMWNLPTPKPITATLRLVSPAEPRHGVAYGLAETVISLSPQLPISLTLPPDLSRGLYLLELRVFGIDGELPARSATGAGRGALYINAVRVEHGPALPANAPTLAQFRDLTLHAIEAQQPDPTTLRLKMAWSTPGTPRNWSLSLRLLDADGRQLAQRDLQPGYGYLPTTLWRPGELVTDYPVLSVPEGLAPGEYTLRVITYLEATMETGGEADLPSALTQVTLRDPRESCCEQERQGALVLCEAGGMTLSGLALPATITEGHGVNFTAEWNALTRPPADFTARWELLAADGSIIGAAEGPLAPGSRASTWPRLAWVRAPVTLALPPRLPDGPYQLRLTLLDGESALQSCELGALPVTLRARSFALPAPSYPQQADFGGEIRLLGYDLTQDADTLALTLWWQAQRNPTRDYKRFIHLLDPVTGAVPAQDDAMPRAWSYPTSWWATGEVVSETVTLALGPVPTGAYRLGVGWYDGAGITLPATDAAGASWADNRVILSAITVRQ